MIIFHGEVQAPPAFSFVHHFVPLLTRLRIFLDQLRLAGCTAKGGVSTPTVCPVAVVKQGAPTKTLVS
jgi:hypothetical protein